MNGAGGPSSRLGWRDVGEFLTGVGDCLECGFMIIDERGNIIHASAPVAPIFEMPLET